MCDMKRCSKCGEEKPQHFYRIELATELVARVKSSL